MVKSKSKKSSVKKVNSFEVGDKNYNLIKVKSNYLNLLSASIFITALFIFFLGYIVYYLNILLCQKGCSHALQQIQLQSHRDP